ncbi:MAG: family 20 glycosylhydrolase [Acidobacteria bacterium]|nr:family 20 glycosylhydrolase [Acidobacteriota bacterium]
MKLQFLALVCIFAFSSTFFAQNSAISIIPKPQSVEQSGGQFTLTKKTRIVATGEGGKRLAAILNDLFSSNYGFKLSVGKKALSKDAIVLKIADTSGTEQKGENYTLRVTPALVEIAGDEAGGFYAIQSLIQLMPAKSAGDVGIPAININDSPRFAYRGMHLDVSRHFMPVSFVKKYIDLMSQYKFNTFHWHLTDDQGWRIEIKKYPRLTEIGSKRPETMKERNFAPYIGDGVPVEGFYTQNEIRDVIAYAKARYITIIPEIELPGHASAAMAAYPELGCKQDLKYKVQTTWGIFKETFCPTDTTFKFLEDVLDETIKLFPDSPYVHIGGDEVLKDHWKESPFVQDLMKRENLKDEHEVQSYFIRRIEKFINSKGKKIIGWDEILEGGVAPNATIMSWRGEKGGIEAAKAHHDVIMTPNTYVYFDYGQGDPAYEPLNIGAFIPLEKVYGWDPVPKEIAPDEAKYILGGQANIWTEYLKTPAAVEYMAFPRMIALAEVLWTQPANKDYADFKRRLAADLPRLEAQNVNFRIPEPDGLKNTIVGADGKATLTLRPFAPSYKIFYTLDGTTPNENSRQYTSPVEVEVGKDAVVTVKTIEVIPSGRKSSVYAATFVNREPFAAVEPPQKRPGVSWELFIPNADASGEGTRTTGESRSILLNQFEKNADLKKPFVTTFDGYMNAAANGIYEFQVDATWDVTVLLDGKPIIDDAGTKDRKVRSAVVPLEAGFHKISLRYNHRGGDSNFRVLWGLKGQGLGRAYGGELVH